MSIAARTGEILATHPAQMVLDEAGRALEQAEGHGFAMSRDDVAWLAAALAIALGVHKGRNGNGGRVYKVELRDAVGVTDGV